MNINFENLKRDFNSRIENITNQSLFIQNELKQIDFFINHKDYTQQPKSTFQSLNNRYIPKNEILKNIYNSVIYGWNSFLFAYNDFYYNEVEIEFQGLKSVTGSQIDESNSFYKTHKECHLQGIELAKYTLWLKRSAEKKPSSVTKKSTLSHKQKMLALHYLGLDLSKYDNTKSAKILAQILDLSEENTRKYISYLSAGKNNVRTKSNLEKLSQLFEQQNFIDVSNQINSDIKKM